MLSVISIAPCNSSLAPLREDVCGSRFIFIFHFSLQSEAAGMADSVFHFGEHFESRAGHFCAR